MDKQKNVIGGLAVVVAGLLAANALLAPLLSGARIDLTEGGLYTVSDSTLELVGDLPEPVRLELYWSEHSSEGLPQYSAHAQRVREFLEELVLASGGQLELEVLDPEPYSEAEDAATAAGVASLPVDGAGTRLTLGLVGHDAVDRQEVIPFLDPAQENMLEYEVAKLIHGLALEDAPKVVLIDGVGMQAEMDIMALQMGQPQRPDSQVLAMMRQLFDVEVIHPEDGVLPDDVDTVMVVHPAGISEELLRAIDAHAFGGGAVIAFLDPHCEALAAGAEQDPMAALQGGLPPRGSSLAPLLAAWGVDFTSDRVVGDEKYAARVPMRDGRGGVEEVDYVIWLGLHGESLAADDPMVAGLTILNLSSAGSFSAREDGRATLEPLLSSSDAAGLVDAARVANRPDPSAIARSLFPTGEPHLLATRLTGEIRSAYPAPGTESGWAPAGGIVLVGDVDLLSDDSWIQEQRMGPISLGWRRFADNGDFALNALEVLTGSEALIGLRGGGTASRPFDRVADLRREAEARYQDRETALQAEIAATEARMRNLQTSEDGSGALILTDQQTAELEKLQAEVLTARKELRAVKHGLQQDIDRLGTNLMLANVLGVPALVALFLGAALWRRTRRRPTH